MTDKSEYSPKQRNTVMVSSTFRDLEQHRAKLRRALNNQRLADVGMEHDSALADKDLIDSSLGMVRDSAGYVLVVGRRYGQIPTCPHRNPNSLSITELEFNEALRLERPMLVFFMGEDHDLPADHIDTDLMLVEKLTKFRERVKLFRMDGEVERVYGTFNDLHEFEVEAYRSVPNLKDTIENFLQRFPNLPKPKLWMLPNQPTRYFTGQEDVLTEVHKRLKEGKVSLTQAAGFVGEGGIGKTELALQYCQKFAGEYEKIFWISGRDRAALQTDLARAYEGTFGTDDGLQGQPNANLQRAIRMRDSLNGMTNCLVILDNVDSLAAVQAEDKQACEEVNADIGFIDHLLKLQGPHVLITSRQEHWGRVARMVPVAKLPVKEGALLFLKRALDRPEATTLNEFTDQDKKAALEFAEEVDGFQLALEQSGATANTYKWKPEKYLAEFRKRFADLSQDSGDENNLTHAPIYTTVKLSLEQLDTVSPHAGQLVRWCAYLPPDWIPEELFRVEEGEVYDSIKGDRLERVILVARGQSLLHIDTDHDVLTMHRLIQRIVRLIDSGSELGDPMRYEQLAIAAKFADPGREFEKWAEVERLIPVWRHVGEYGPDSEAVVNGLNCVVFHSGSAWGGLGVIDEAELAVEKARRGLGPRHPDTLMSMNNLASTYSDLGRHADALLLEEEVLSARREVLGPHHSDTLNSMNNLAMTYGALGRHADALLMKEEVLSARREVLGPRHPDTLNSMNNLAMTYSDLGRHADSLLMKEEVLDARREVLGPRHPDTLRSMNNLASTYGDLGRHADSLLMKEEVLDARREVLGLRHPTTLTSMNNLASTYSDLGRHADALLMNEEVLSAHREVLGPRHPNTLASMNNLALTCWALGRFKEAIDLERQCLEGFVQALGADHPTTKTVQRLLSQMLAARPDLALPGELESLLADQT